MFRSPSTSYCSFYYLMNGYDGNGALEYAVRTVPHKVANTVRLFSYCPFRYLMHGYDGNGALEYALLTIPIRW